MSQVLGEASPLKWTSFIKSRRVTMRLWRLLVVLSAAGSSSRPNCIYLQLLLLVYKRLGIIVLEPILVLVLAAPAIANHFLPIDCNR
jgi:hypothetical protein